MGQKWNQLPAWAFPKGELARGPADREEIVILAAETEARAGKRSLTPWASSRPQGMTPAVLPPSDPALGAHVPLAVPSASSFVWAWAKGQTDLAKVT